MRENVFRKHFGKKENRKKKLLFHVKYTNILENYCFRRIPTLPSCVLLSTVVVLYKYILYLYICFVTLERRPYKLTELYPYSMFALRDKPFVVDNNFRSDANIVSIYNLRRYNLFI